MPSYTPPPPVVVTSVASAVRNAVSPPTQPDIYLALHRQEAQLQADLQRLLDAQADGLTAGLRGGPETVPEDLLSNGSTTPTASTSLKSSNRATAAEARRPKPREVGLNGARRGLWKTIRKLATVKAEEASLINGNIEDNDEVLRKINIWEQKSTGLQNSIQSIAQGSEEGARANSLHHEAESLGSEIQELESRLGEMKSRHGFMLQEVSRLENSIQARLSSYNESLGIVQREVRKFLERPPIDGREGGRVNKGKSGSSQAETFLSLAPRRRTLEMAKGHWESQRQRLERRRDLIEFEKEALEEGAVVWKDAVNEAIEFEAKLRDNMHKTDPNRRDTSTDTKEDDLQALLKEMDQTIVQMESKLRLAEARDWKLLVCCIGAELEAFKQGKEILEGALEEEEPPEESSPEELQAQADFPNLSGGLLGQDPSTMTNSRESIPQHSSAKNKAYDTEDDEPDPELLISHEDTSASE